MRREIDILEELAAKDYAVVEKETNLLWTGEELAEACWTGRFRANSDLLAPGGQVEVSGPFPGCLSGVAAADAPAYRAVGQTEHFVIFATTETASAQEAEN